MFLIIYILIYKEIIMQNYYTFIQKFKMRQ